MSLSPDAAVLLLTVGVLLIYVELNRPGAILPGALGIFATLLSIAALRQLPVRPPALALCATSIVLLALDIFRPTHVLVGLAATLALTLGLTNLVVTPAIHRVVAISCGLLLGLGTSYLTHIARRARTNKRTARAPERLD